MTTSTGSQCGSFGKGGSDLWIPREALAAQLGVVDLALNRVGAQDFRFVKSSL